jgi:RNA polymerase sigma-70 factor (ECF subfamily)
MARDEGFEAFFDAHHGRVVQVLALGWGDHAAEDAAQEAFARALQRWSRVRRMDRPDGWVYVTAVNVLRRRHRDDASDAALDVTREPPERHLDSTEGVTTRVLLRDALALLPPRQRQVVVLRYLADFSTTDVAAAMGCAEGTVKSALSQALRSLRVDLEDDDGRR